MPADSLRTRPLGSSGLTVSAMSLGSWRTFERLPPETGAAILAVRVGDLGEKEAVLAANPDAFFTIPHFDGYAAVLIQLRKASAAALREAITDGWLACAPAKLADQYLHR